jgi:hypothetical protein
VLSVGVDVADLDEVVTRLMWSSGQDLILVVLGPLSPGVTGP